MELRYMGFHQEQNTRVYSFDCTADGKSAVRLAVSVDMRLFLKHRVGIQEGPTLCAQKLTADLASNSPEEHELTNADLVAYTADRAAAEARKAESRRPGPARRKPDSAPNPTPWR